MNVSSVSIVSFWGATLRFLGQVSGGSGQGNGQSCNQGCVVSATDRADNPILGSAACLPRAGSLSHGRWNSRRPRKTEVCATRDAASPSTINAAKRRAKPECRLESAGRLDDPTMFMIRIDLAHKSHDLSEHKGLIRPSARRSWPPQLLLAQLRDHIPLPLGGEGGAKRRVRG